MNIEFDTIWKGLALDDAAGLPTDVTVTSRTFLADELPSSKNSAAPLAFDRTSAAAGAAETDLRRAELPRISIALSRHRSTVASALSSHTASGRPDLEITALLGEGGMGRIHLARQRSLDRDIAIKVVRHEIDSPEVSAALVTEAVITGFLEHPNIIPVHALGRDDNDRPVLVMKRVDGVSWRDVLRDSEHRGWARLLAVTNDRLVASVEILMQVSNALHFAHSRGVIHRDVKPENVMIGEFGEVYLVDFGIALRVGLAATQPSAVPATEQPPAFSLVGTPAYMAPEMVGNRAGTIDARTDVYLLGATLHEVLTGDVRHTGATLHMVLLEAYESRPFKYPNNVPVELAAICGKATHADPAKRYPSALAFRQALAEYVQHRGSIALGEAARARLAEMHELIAATRESKPDAAVQQLHRAMSECRFGFTHALKEWGDNAVARAGLQECLETMARYEIARGNADGARALITEFAEARPDIETELRALDARVAEQHGRDEQLRSMQRDLDVRIGSRSRAALFTLIGLVGTVITIRVMTLERGGNAISHVQLLQSMGGLLAVLLVAVVVTRKNLLANAINRSIVGVVICAVAAIVLHRVMGMRLGTPTHDVIGTDMLIMGSILTASGLTVLPWLGWAGTPFLAGALVATLQPDLAPISFGIATLASLAIIAFNWNRRSPNVPRD